MTFLTRPSDAPDLQPVPAIARAAHGLAADKKYMPALDGMRAFSIAVVVASHLWNTGVIPGGFGVTVFFFISGFLITRLLLAEFSDTGHVSVSRFYVRRFLRLYPALVALIAVLSVIYFLMRGHVDALEIIAALFYFINYYALAHPGIEMPIRMLWSLAIEEHYYLAFPLIFSLLVRRLRQFITLLSVIAVLTLVWRLYQVYVLKIDLNPPNPGLPHTYIATDSRIDSILYGAILSLLAHSKSGARFVQRLVNWPVFCVATAIMLLAFLPRDPAFQETWRYTIQGVMLVPMVACCVFGEQFGILRKVLEFRTIVWIGKISYSIYLWHFGIVRLIKFEFPDMSVLGQTAIGLPIIFTVAAMSYYLIELPVTGLRARWR